MQKAPEYRNCDGNKMTFLLVGTKSDKIFQNFTNFDAAHAEQEKESTEQVSSSFAEEVFNLSNNKLLESNGTTMKKVFSNVTSVFKRGEARIP